MPDNKKYEELSKKYDELFKKYDLRWDHKPEKNYFFGLGGMGAGWFNLIEECIKDCIALGWDKHVGQIKEKFGGLRFYIGSASGQVHQRVSKAEEESYKICEECGKPGVLRSGNWIRTLCDEHAEGRQPANFEVPKPFVLKTSTTDGGEKTKRAAMDLIGIPEEKEEGSKG